MKNKAIIFITVFGLIFMFSCKKELTDPKLDMSQTVQTGINSPANGTAYVLLQEEADNPLTTFEWSETQYNVDNLEDTKYTLQMAVAGTNFEEPNEIYTGTGTSLALTVGGMNQEMLSMELETGVAHNIEFRVASFLNDLSDYTMGYSSAISLEITPYEDVVEAKPIYLLGSGTTVGWDNTAALEMAHLGEARYARVEYLVPGADQFIKFISVLGFWAPQWGTDDTGTAEEGPLVYRPTEEVEDPAAIPVGEVEGSYYIEADTVNLEYKTFLTSGELYLVGAATTAGWDNTAGLPFTEVEPHIFEITTTLTEGGMKFLEVLGQWAPQWGTNDTASGEGGPLIYRPEESVPDPAEVPSPGAGNFTIRVDLTTISYTITAN